MCFTSWSLTIMYSKPYVYIMYYTFIMVYIYMYYSHGLIKHGLKKLLLYVSLILRYM
jgi:hypothetical protein